MNKTSIEWCRTYAPDGSFAEGYSVNPIRFRPKGSDRLTTMCQKTSPGCTRCYASDIVRRFYPKNLTYPGYTAQGIAAGDFVLDEKQLVSVLKHKKPCKIFWMDMTDGFGDWVPFEMLDKCFAVCALTPHITHMFLTKRPENMLRYYKEDRYPEVIRAADYFRQGIPTLGNIPVSNPFRFPYKNIWVGTSCENQKYADERIPVICQVPAKVHFISAEPLIGPIDLGWPKSIYPDGPPMCCSGLSNQCGCMGMPTDPPLCYGLEFCIVGGESGPKARPMASSWAGDLQEQCARWNIAFFYKQAGEFIDAGHEEFGRLPSAPIVHVRSDGTLWPKDGVPTDEDADVLTMKRVGRKRAGDTLYGKVYHEFPEAR